MLPLYPRVVTCTFIVNSLLVLFIFQFLSFFLRVYFFIALWVSDKN